MIWSGKPVVVGIQARLDRSMRIYVFESQGRSELCAFASDAAGSKLPAQHGPWLATGVIGPGTRPPHNLSRAVIERALSSSGFQLWRRARKAEKAEARA